jgi:uncharacterized Tic20 family protein
MGFYKTLTFVMALVGSLLAVASVALYEGYIDVSLVGGITDTEMGFFSVLAIVVAILAYTKAKEE